ncbi:hypothetical protein [Proteus mirabilis]|uniref:hypothetical protein n=1 Tax=Proteus mirabilis TaxID=584 RepID=UPI002282E126|nr:hypothetical protein [Proteus mirabilis]MCY9778548.1 hypothetical protein [Proteus mirabilis]MCY9781608.1 hypothetical protein [Proteus mirabilis]MCY9790734.1 hypothetical protein [Proteus mirabilis]
MIDDGVLMIYLNDGEDYSLYIAILSLLFTCIIGFISIRYTKISLAQNKKSNKLAEDSLIEARKNYEDQRNRLEQEAENTKETNIMGINIINGIFIDEVEVFIKKFLQIINHNSNDNIVSFNFEKRDGLYFFEFKDNENKPVDATNFWLIKTDVFYNYIFEAARIDGKCLHDLRSIYIIYIELERLFHTFIFLGEEEHLKKYSEINKYKYDSAIEYLRNDLLKIKDTLNLKKLDEYNMD